MSDKHPSQDDILRILSRMAPPRVPEQVFNKSNSELAACEGWHKYTAAAMIGGLQTEPGFHANGVRLDWLLRLVLAKSKGRSKPTRHDLTRALNAGMAKSGVIRLEDPSEDLFCEQITSESGNFRLFSGQWEAAGAYTQTLIDAFQSLPYARQKQAALTSAYALLSLSEAVADRAGVDRFTEFGVNPREDLELPTSEELSRLGERVRFSDADLKDLGILKAALAPYILDPQQFPAVSDRDIGNTPLEFHPLIETPAGYILASPPNVSLAVRAVLLSTAKEGGMATTFQHAIMEQQEAYSHAGHFWPTNNLQLSPPNRFDIRAAVGEYEPGHFVQIIQVPGPFENFPREAFASVHTLSSEAIDFLRGQIEGFWSYTQGLTDCRQTTTAILVSGWGAAYRLTPPINETKAPKSWQFFALNFADAGVMGVVPDSNFSDLSRLLWQETRLLQDGFEFQNMNGVLNLLGFWKTTGGNLIPEHMLDIQPPTFIAMPTNELLELRRQAVRRRDSRALPLPGGQAKVVERMEWSDDEELQSTYASREDIRQFRLSAAVAVDGRTWWLESQALPGENREWRYRTWHALLQWIEAVAGKVIEIFPAAFPREARKVELLIPRSTAFESIDIRHGDSSQIEATLRIAATPEGGSVEILADWLPFIALEQNDAEVALTVATLTAFTHSGGAAPPADQLRAAILEAVGSRDWRWLHAHHAVRTEDRLIAAGLTDEFLAIPYSAHALVRCGSIWNFRDREAGAEIDGKEACQQLVVQYCDEMLKSLIADVRQFDRHQLCTASAERYQNARVEQSRWRNTIRALRAISGSAADIKAFERQNAINGTQRAAKILAEIAACEALLTGGKTPSLTEIDEMFAKAVLIFGNGQLYGAILTDLIPPKLRVSPAGDLLSEREIFGDILRPGVEWMNRRMLNEAAESYGTRRRPTTGDQSLDPQLRIAIEAEFRTTAEGFIDLQFALIDLAKQRGSGVFAIGRSDLHGWLVQHEAYRSADPTALLSRLTLPSRDGWLDLSGGLRATDIDFGRFDRPWSLINRPLLALDDTADPVLLVSPMLVADSTLYCLAGLMNGTLNERFWETSEARRYAGGQGKAAGDEFEDDLAARLRGLGLTVIPRCKLSGVLNQKVPDDLGDIDALAVSADGKRVWAIEAKNLRLCRTETEAASRMQEYRGMMVDHGGKLRPDKMLRHLRRVEYLRQHRGRLPGRLKLSGPPEVHGLLVVEAPQPMNFHTQEANLDGRSVFIDALDDFQL